MVESVVVAVAVAGDKAPGVDSVGEAGQTVVSARRQRGGVEVAPEEIVRGEAGETCRCARQAAQRARVAKGHHGEDQFVGEHRKRVSARGIARAAALPHVPAALSTVVGPSVLLLVVITTTTIIAICVCVCDTQTLAHERDHGVDAVAYDAVAVSVVKEIGHALALPARPTMVQARPLTCGRSACVVGEERVEIDRTCPASRRRLDRETAKDPQRFALHEAGCVLFFLPFLSCLPPHAKCRDRSRSYGQASDWAER
ncbi:hypothetical protein [Pandoravirus japonicus]|uniref:Uncharacterized protein n=1 Tax=Pandoravirus japonicus TaxID=2823154 RepID=A0A811BS27_9VIRU|nr:hypothetical protein [Pandoravirus japonicus]